MVQPHFAMEQSHNLPKLRLYQLSTPASPTLDDLPLIESRHFNPTEFKQIPDCTSTAQAHTFVLMFTALDNSPLTCRTCIDQTQVAQFCGRTLAVATHKLPSSDVYHNFVDPPPTSNSRADHFEVNQFYDCSKLQQLKTLLSTFTKFDNLPVALKTHIDQRQIGQL